MKLLIVVNVDWFFATHRLPIAIGALQKGYEVHIATTFTSPLVKETLSEYGLFLHELTLDRSGKQPISFLVNFLQIFKILRLLQPDVLHLVTLQPVLLGGLAARAAGIRRVVFAISGLGHVFLGSSLASRIRRFLVERLYRSALSIQYRVVVFQNSSDQFLISRLCTLSVSESCQIPGSGVDLSVFSCKPLQDTQTIILMASRLLATKGVREFVESAVILRNRGYSARFQLVGDPDFSNPAAISNDELNGWREQGLVELLGHRHDLCDLMAHAHIVCLPSYREGLPKVLCEAAACGRVVVTTNVPGCRDAIDNGVTGLLVPARDSIALSNALEHLLLNPDLIRSMGLAGRKRAEQFFNINSIVDQHLDIYSRLVETA